MKQKLAGMIFEKEIQMLLIHSGEGLVGGQTGEN